MLQYQVNPMWPDSLFFPFLSYINIPQNTPMWNARGKFGCEIEVNHKDSGVQSIEALTYTQWFSNLSLHQKQLKGFLQYGLLGPAPEDLLLRIWVGAWECAFLSSFQELVPHVWHHTLGTTVLSDRTRCPHQRESLQRSQERPRDTTMVPAQAPEVT